MYKNTDQTSWTAASFQGRQAGRNQLAVVSQRQPLTARQAETVSARPKTETANKCSDCETGHGAGPGEIGAIAAETATITEVW